MTNIQADAPVTARDHIRAYLRTAESATRAQLVAALSGKVAAQTIDNFIHDGKKSGEIEVERHTYGHHRVKLRANFIDPRRAMRATLLEVKVAIVELLQQSGRPLSIDVIIAALPAGTDESIVRALVKSMAKAGMLLSSLDDGSPCYQLANAYRASSNTNPYHLLRDVERTEYVSPPAPSSAPTEAPTGPALVATPSPASPPSPDADIPTASTAAPETSTRRTAPADWPRLRDAILLFEPSKHSLCVMADGFASGMRDMAVHALALSVPPKLVKEIFLSALQAQRTAIELRTHEALWSYLASPGGEA